MTLPLDVGAAWRELERATIEDSIIEAARELKRARDKRYRTRLRLAALEYLGGQCTECGEARPTRLHFHHKDPATKTASIAYLIRTRPGLIRAELDKCEILCRRCHDRHHYHNGG